MYYQTQLRNLTKEAELSSQLLAAQFLQNRVLDDKQKSIKNNNYTPSRFKRDKEIAIHLARSQIQAELDATNLSTNAVLNRSRIQAALDLRQKNHQYQIATQRIRKEQQQLYLKALRAQEDRERERQRELQLKVFHQQSLRQDVWRSIARQQEETLEYQLRQLELRQQVEEAQVRKQIRQKYESLENQYFYY